MLARKETQISFRLKAEILQNDKILIVFTDDMDLFIIVLISGVLLVLVVIILVARR